MNRLLERLRVRRSIGEELDAHLQEKIADLVESGVPEREARLRARREFGNMALIAEDSRDALGWPWFDSLAKARGFMNVRDSLLRNRGHGALAADVVAYFATLLKL